MKYLCKGRILVLALIVFSCAKKQDTSEDAVMIEEDTTSQEQTNAFLQVMPVKSVRRNRRNSLEIERAISLMEENKDLAIAGYWVGAFGRNKINIAIAGITDGKANGYTV